MYVLMACGSDRGRRQGSTKALGLLDQEFLITDLLELKRLLSGLRAVNHEWTRAGVAVTSAWLFPPGLPFHLNLSDNRCADLIYIVHLL